MPWAAGGTWSGTPPGGVPGPPWGGTRSGTPPGVPDRVPPQGGPGTPPGGGVPDRVPLGGGVRVPPRGGTQVGQQKEYSLHGGRYASCVHAGGLSCGLYFHCTCLPFAQNESQQDRFRQSNN